MSPALAQALAEVLRQRDKAGPQLVKQQPALAEALDRLSAQTKAATR